jgi:hypothetical protein
VLQELIHLFAPLTANCRDFTNRWDAAGTLDRAGVSGRWEGEWISEVSGHRGPLQCVLTPVAPALWHMAFRASYSKFFRACYTTHFNVVQEEGRWSFTGSQDLGKIAGGQYEYTGQATVTEMTCQYRSAADAGEFRLSRTS